MEWCGVWHLPYLNSGAALVERGVCIYEMRPTKVKRDLNSNVVVRDTCRISTAGPRLSKEACVYIWNETHKLHIQWDPQKTYGIRPTTVKRDLIAKAVVCDSCHVSTAKPHLSKETCAYIWNETHKRQKRPNCECCGMWFMSRVNGGAALVERGACTYMKWDPQTTYAMRPTNYICNETHKLHMQWDPCIYEKRHTKDIGSKTYAHKTKQNNTKERLNCEWCGMCFMSHVSSEAAHVKRDVCIYEMRPTKVKRDLIANGAVCDTCHMSTVEPRLSKEACVYIWNETLKLHMQWDPQKTYGIRPTKDKRDLIANVVVCDSCHVSTAKPHLSKETCVDMKWDPHTIYGTRHIHTRQKRPNCECCGVWFVSHVNSETAHVKRDVWICEMRPTKDIWNKTHAHKTKEA